MRPIPLGNSSKAHWQGQLKAAPRWAPEKGAFNETGASFRDRIDYAVCGGLAVAIHGLVRATRDIDLLIQREDLDRVVMASRRCGFNLEGGMLPMGVGEPFPRDIFRISKVIDSKVIEKDLVTLDLLIVNPLLQAAWDRREYYDWRGRKLQAVSPAGLYVMKKLAGRPQDILDLQSLGLWPDDSTS